jgi:hypothetical protein
VRYCGALKRAVTLKTGPLMSAREASAAAGWLMLGTMDFLASAAGRLGAGRRAVSAGSGLASGSRQPLAGSADGVAARRLAVAVFVLHDLSRGMSNSD